MTFPTAQDCRRVGEPLRAILAEFDERVRSEIVAVAGTATANGVDAAEALRCATTILMSLAAACAKQSDEATAAGDATDFCSLAAHAVHSGVDPAE